MEADLKFQEAANAETLFLEGSGTTIKNGQFFILTKLYSKNNDLTSNIDLRLNGQSLTYNISENSITSFPGNAGLTIGGSYNGANKVKLHLAEIFIADGRLSEAKITELENKIYEKYLEAF